MTHESSDPTKRHLLGTHRVDAPEHTWARLVPVLEVAGITRIADITSFDNLGIPVFQAIRPRSRNLAVSQGKGVTPLLSRISAAMESLEWMHAEDIGVPATRATLAEMVPGLGYPPELLTIRPLSLLNDDMILDWLPAQLPGTEASSFVPREFVEFSFAVRAGNWPRVFPGSTTGLCSGNTLDEAASHGLYEVIERDCIHDLEHTPQQQRRRVEHATVRGVSADLLGRFFGAGNEVDIVDATNSLGVPCYHVQIRAPTFPLWCIGSGAHLDPDVALCRALTEAAQSRAAVISSTREDEPGLWDLFEQSVVPGTVIPSAHTAFRRDAHVQASILVDVADLAARITNKTGYRPLLVDLTRGDIGIPVGKVIAPGLGEPEQH